MSALIADSSQMASGECPTCGNPHNQLCSDAFHIADTAENTPTSWGKTHNRRSDHAETPMTDTPRGVSGGFDNGCPDCFGTGVDVYHELCATCDGRPADRSDPPPRVEGTTELHRNHAAFLEQYRLMRDALERLDGPAHIQHPQRLIRNVMNRVRDLEAGAK